MQQFDRSLSQVINSTFGVRCKFYGYQYSEILRSLMCIYFCGGSCIEDVTTHLMYHLSLHPTLNTCSADTILRAIKELTRDNISYTSHTGKTYDFSTADKLNTLLLNCLLSTGQLKISVPTKWVRTSRQYVLNIYSCNNAYADVFLNDFGKHRQLMVVILRIASSRIVG